MSGSTTGGGPATVGALLSSSPTLRARTAHISMSDWRAAVGPRLAARTHPDRLSDGQLTVRVPSSTWAQELSMLATVVMERLSATGHPVRKLRFMVSEGPPRPQPLVTTVRRAPLPEPLMAALGRVDDPDLRTAIAEAAAYSLGRSARTRG
jgi:hypothetical protein